MASFCLDLLRSEIGTEIWPCFWPPLRAPTVGARRCLQKQMLFWPSVSGCFFTVVYSFGVSVQIDPDLPECITPRLQYAALDTEKVRPLPAAIAVRRTYCCAVAVVHVACAPAARGRFWAGSAAAANKALNKNATIWWPGRPVAGSAPFLLRLLIRQLIRTRPFGGLAGPCPVPGRVCCGCE